MIATLSPSYAMQSSLPVRAAGTQPRCDEPCPEPCPPPPSDSLDFSKIDSPVKAALLPAMEPAAQLGIVAGIIFAVMSGAQTGAVPLVTVDVATKNADQLTNVSYNIDLKNEESPLSGSGTIGGQDTSSELAIDQSQSSASLTETIGASNASLALGVDQKSQQLSANGKFGDMDVALTFSAIKGDGGSDDFKGFHVEGNIGGQAYSLDNMFDASKAMEGQEAQMTSRGKLGDAEISKDYTISAAQTPTGVELSIAGAGTTAGIAQDVNVKMTLIG